MTACTRSLLLALALATALALAVPGARAAAEGLPDDANAEWRLEQPAPPPPPPGVEPSAVKVGLGKVGDIEFWAPNRGVLITAGNPPTVPAGIWAYNGTSWRELATVCGATDGRIAWAGPDEFWTISDGRPGQAANPRNGERPPLEDNTLCHFAEGGVVGSYASLAFRASSYQPMHAAGCLNAADCWFGGDPLLPPQEGAFHLHWNGSTVTAEAGAYGHPVEDMRSFDGHLFESVRVREPDLEYGSEESPFEEPSDLHQVLPEGTLASNGSPFESLKPGVPTYRTLINKAEEEEQEVPWSLDYLHLSADEDSLWGAASPVVPVPAESLSSEVTIVRDSGGPSGPWTQVIGPSTDPAGGNPFTRFLKKPEETKREEEEKKREEEAREEENEGVSSIAAEPGSEAAWLALTSRQNSVKGSVAHAFVARIAADKTVSDRETLPSSEEEHEGVGPKGAPAKIICPAAHDCWMVTTQGWLFHLSTEANRTLPAPSDEAFAKDFEGPLITFRPPDAGTPPVIPDSVPIDDSGLLGEPPPTLPSLEEVVTTEPEASVTAPLLTHLRTRLVHGDTLELRFDLAVKARIRLLAERRKRVVASTPTRTLAGGARKLLLRLNPRNWPTKLDLQTHALAPLPKLSIKGVGTNEVSTSLAFPNRLSAPGLGPIL